MAKAGTKKEEPVKTRGGIALPLALVTALGLGGGYGASQFLSSSAAIAHRQQAPTPKASGENGTSQFVVADLAPILTNIAAPEGTWIRLELSVLSPKALDTEAQALIEQDIMAYLRGLELDHVSSPSGFMTFREALNDRAAFHARDVPARVLVRTMLFE